MWIKKVSGKVEKLRSKCASFLLFLFRSAGPPTDTSVPDLLTVSQSFLNDLLFPVERDISFFSQSIADVQVDGNVRAAQLRLLLQVIQRPEWQEQWVMHVPHLLHAVVAAAIDAQVNGGRKQMRCGGNKCAVAR